MSNTQGKVAIVTGSIRGIGLEIACELARRGVMVALTYFDWLDSLDSMHERIRQTGTPYIAIPADLTRETHVDRVVNKTLETFGRLDILVNNIERGGWPIVHGPYTKEQWDLELRTTVDAKYHLFQKSLPSLRADGGGAVVNITSIAGEVGRSGPAGLVFNDCYSLANKGVRIMTEQWARQGAPEVRVNELVLGFIETRHGPKTRGWALMSDSDKKAILDHTLLGRTGHAVEVAKAVRFLALEADFITGASLRMDGGYVLGGDRAVPMPEGVVSPKESTLGGGMSIYDMEDDEN